MRFLMTAFILLTSGCTTNVELDPPLVLGTGPAFGSTIVGDGIVTLLAHVEDDSTIKRIELVDGDELLFVGTPEHRNCQAGCDMTVLWDTTDLAEGEQNVTLRVIDLHDNIGQTSFSITLLDALYVDEIAVTGMLGDAAFAPNFEVEVHLYDAESGLHLGCGGREHGLRSVNTNDVQYNVDAWFIGTRGERLSFDSLSGRQVRFVVTENDDTACPTAESATSPRTLRDDDDLFGDSGPVAIDDLADGMTLSFTGVPSLTLASGRPFGG